MIVFPYIEEFKIGGGGEPTILSYSVEWLYCLQCTICASMQLQ